VEASSLSFILLSRIANPTVNSAAKGMMSANFGKTAGVSAWVAGAFSPCECSWADTELDIIEAIISTTAKTLSNGNFINTSYITICETPLTSWTLHLLNVIQAHA
jgi:hypothetical protein